MSSSADAIAELVRNYYGGQPDAEALLREAADMSLPAEQREVASTRLVALERARLDPDAWERGDGDAKRRDLSRPAVAGPRPWIESGPAFLAVDDPPLQHVIAELVPAGLTGMGHGEPRTFKTWYALELVIASATGTAAFGLPRFTVTEPMPALYVGQEDSRQRTRERLRAILAGRGMSPAPERLFVAVHSGIDLENPEWREAIKRDARRFGLRLIVLDPMRRLAASVDKGPSEVRAVTTFTRELAEQTGAAVIAMHHDVKPSRDGRDDRRRAHRASGGDWFASTDCPVALERAGETSIVYPSDFKHGQDPRPFRFRIVESARGGLLVAGEELKAGADAGNVALQERLLDFMAEHPHATTRALERGMRGAGNGAVRDALETLLAEGKVDRTQGPKRSWLWFVSES